MQFFCSEYLSTPLQVNFEDVIVVSGFHPVLPEDTLFTEGVGSQITSLELKMFQMLSQK